MNRIKFDELLYQTLRRYQDGEYHSNVGVGKLTPELTVVYDKVRDAAMELKHRFPDTQTEAYALCGKCGECALCKAVRAHVKDIREAAKPVDMIIHCPSCGTQHVDKPDPTSCKNCGRWKGSHAVAKNVLPCDKFTAWDNPPHKKHRCLKCNLVFRIANVPTNGVAELPEVTL